MNKDLLDHISYLLCIKVDRFSPLSGGDVSKVFLLETASERFVCKINKSLFAFDSFKAEKEGLEAIANTKTIATPKIYHCEVMDQGAFLLMEYIDNKPADSNNMETLGHHIAALHHLGTANSFGWRSHNFIGSLPQSNLVHSNWTSFYVEERLLPQLKLAYENNRLSYNEVPTEEKLTKRCVPLFTDVTPTLLHGDLWRGNFLISTAGLPYLIDPASYYGHNEVDIAMSKLFGGFSTAFYSAYRAYIPSPKNEIELTDMYQLYYLLVHLNMFGAPYYGQVTSLLKRYF